MVVMISDAFWSDSHRITSIEATIIKEKVWKMKHQVVKA